MIDLFFLSFDRVPSHGPTAISIGSGGHKFEDVGEVVEGEGAFGGNFEIAEVVVPDAFGGLTFGEKDSLLALPLAMIDLDISMI